LDVPIRDTADVHTLCEELAAIAEIDLDIRQVMDVIMQIGIELAGNAGQIETLRDCGSDSESGRTAYVGGASGVR
jgi:hypothetical protein